MPTQLLWVVFLAPLLAAGAIWTLFSRRPRLAAGVSIGAVAVSFVISFLFFWEALRSPTGIGAEQISLTWISLAPSGPGAGPTLEIGFGLVRDHLSILLALVVTGVGGMIHVYSLGYMKGDRGFARYFGCLSLFTASMLGIILSTNFIQIFIFWELVGLCSYLLIGHWYERPSAAEAGKKAFIVNRIGDFGFLLGILLLYFATGQKTFDFVALQALLAAEPLGTATATAIAVLIFCGAVGKSAQFPLHVWLPDAMEGPTPVSALIHAATMVAAGIYLLARVFFIFEPSPDALTVVAVIGGGTAFIAATMALVQTDLKRILAYSTISQLGYMVLALGVGGYTAGVFHLTTHAFFKALLFLCAGSVIHALHTQEIFEMGGLFRRMKVTSWTFLVGALALAGVPPFSGFFSKDEILLAVRERSTPLFLLAVLTAVLTAAYVGRVLIVAFLGKPRGKEAERDSPGVMTVPLVILAIFAFGLGFISLGGGFAGFIHWGGGGHETGIHWDVMAFSTAAAALGLGAAWALYGKGPSRAAALAARLRPLHTLLLRKYYMDDLYLWLVRVVNDGTARVAFAVDRYVLIGTFVNGTAVLVRGMGKVTRTFQTGRMRTYGTYFLLGLCAVLYVFLRGR